MDKQRDFYNLDHSELVKGLKEYLKQKDEFKDYNFEGSALKNLIDILAYVNLYGGSYLNFSVNELFLRHAQNSDNVLKLANMLNYIPRRRSAPSITATITKNTSDQVYIPAYSKFSMGNSIVLTNLEDIVLTETSTDITLYEGEWVEEEFTSDGTDFQKYELSSREEIDQQHFFVFVYPWNGADNDVDVEQWNSAHENKWNVNGKNFYVEYYESFWLKFDNGRLFKKPAQYDKILVKYLKTNGSTYNSTTGQILLTSNITGGSNLVFSTTSILSGGVSEESIDEIKARAPQYYTTQNRSVTEKDYNIIVQGYPKRATLSDIYAWSGHREFVAILDNKLIETIELGKRDLGYGYLSAIKSDMSYLSNSEISDLDTYMLDYRYMMTFQKFLHPNVLFIEPTVNIKFKNFLNVDLESMRETIVTYLNQYRGFNKKFNWSNFVRTVDSLPYVDYINITYKTFIKVKNESYKVIRVWDKVKPGTISGTINNKAIVDNNEGKILYDGQEIGTINYLTGFMVIEYDFGLETYELSFEYEDLLSFNMQRESFLDHRNLTITVI